MCAQARAVVVDMEEGVINRMLKVRMWATLDDDIANQAVACRFSRRQQH